MREGWSTKDKWSVNLTIVGAVIAVGWMFLLLADDSIMDWIGAFLKSKFPPEIDDNGINSYIRFILTGMFAFGPMAIVWAYFNESDQSTPLKLILNIFLKPIMGLLVVLVLGNLFYGFLWVYGVDKNYRNVNVAHLFLLIGITIAAIVLFYFMFKLIKPKVDE